MKINCITIVTPSFNQGKYIEQTIKSILSQQGDFRIEYIIADGGSTDNSINIIKKYAGLLKDKKYSVRCKGIKYHFWSKKDRGQTFALNKALKIAKGEICGWISSDDWLEPKALATVVSYFRKTNADIIYGGCNFIKDDGKRGGILQKYIPTPIFDYDKLLNHRNFIPNPSTFLKKRLLQRMDFIDNSYQWAFDYDLWLRCAKAGGLFSPCKEIVSNCRIHQETKTEKFKLQSFYEQREISRKFGGRFFSPINYLYLGEFVSHNFKTLAPLVDIFKFIYRSIFSYK